MTPAFWILRALNLAAALAVAQLAWRGRAASVALPAAVFAAAILADGAAVFSGRPAGKDTRRAAGLAAGLLNMGLLAWLSLWTPATAGAFDAAFLLPAVLIAEEFGAAAGAAAGLAAGAFVAFELGRTPGPDGGSFLPAALARTAFFALAPAAAGLACASARAEAAAGARGTVARLRAAQVGEYISLVLFQLRDYLITISSIAETLALRAPGDEARSAEKVERLRRTAAELGAKMTRLLGDKSALTTVEAPTQSATDLRALSRAVAREAVAAFARPGVAVDVVAQGEVPPARTDPKPIELALLAVLQNSLEACAARGGGRVTVLLRREGGAVELEIADDGGGIAEAVKPLVFEPLACARPGGSMGLGLPMARRFLERLGGSLRLKSKGGYTAALIVVPLERELPVIRNEESTWAGRRG